MNESLDNMTLHYGAIIMGLAGGLALFLYGMREMTEALKIVAGSGMKKILARLTTNRFYAALAGILITAVIQSSSVTTVLLVGFISAGLMTFAQSLGVIIGANIGTTITAQIIAFKITKYALPMIAIGFLLETTGKSRKVRHYGTMLLGLGLLFFGMELMSQSTLPLREYQPFIKLIRGMHNPFLGIIIGAVFTAIVQSSSATTGIIIVLAGQGFISLEAGIALVFGANIGTCITALLSAIGRPREAMQAATAHVVFKVMGVLLWLAFIPQFADIVRSFSPSASHLVGIARDASETPRQIANAHTLFNVVNAMIFIWFTGPVAKLVCLLVPERKEIESVRMKPKYLDEYYMEQPDTALDRTKLELLRMGHIVLGMLWGIVPAVAVGRRRDLLRLRALDEDVDILYGAVIAYLGKLSLKELVDPQPKRISKHIAIANYLESIGDVVETNLVEQGIKRRLEQITVDPSIVEILRPIHETLCETLEKALKAFKEADVEMARWVVASKADFKKSLEETRNQLMKMLVLGPVTRFEIFSLTNEISLSFERIHTLCRRIGSAVEEVEAAPAPVD